jgi:signal transduction histidine kinase/CheY-like chemotaxis protein
VLAWRRASELEAYLATIGFVVIATALRVAVDKYIFGAQFFTFCLAIFGSAFVGGGRAGFLAVLLSTLSAWYFLVPPYTFEFLVQGEPITLMAFAACGVVVVLLIASLQTAAVTLEEQTAERIKAERSLYQIKKMEAVGQLTGGLAHELNNLLTVVMGNLDFIRSEPQDAVRVVSRADSAHSAVERAAHLIKQLLMFARRQVMRPVNVDLNRLIAEFDKLLIPEPGKEIELVTQLDANVGASCVDPALFESAMLNLVMNACDAISDNGRIVIGTQSVELDTDFVAENPNATPGDYVMVTVGDTGRGISADIISQVFDPFFTTKDVGEGAGLGLSQVYGFARESGGHVRIDSTVGVGTIVRLYLPRSAETEILTEPGTNTVLLQKTSGSVVVVLVVEDDELVLTLAAEILREFGYRILTANNAAEALVVLNGNEPIDILFSDVVMPGDMNGVQLVIEARRLRPGIRVLLTSGYPATVIASQHNLPGNIPLLGKPYRSQDLAESFRNLLDVVAV